MKKLYGAALKAHLKKVGKKTKSAAKRTSSKTTLHKAYSYRTSSGKLVRVAAHYERTTKRTTVRTSKAAPRKKGKTSHRKKLYGAAAAAKKGVLMGAAARASERRQFVRDDVFYG